MAACVYAHSRHQTVQYVCSPVVVMDYTVDRLTFSAGVQAFPLLPYADIPKENDGYSILFHAGVASCIYDFCLDSQGKWQSAVPMAYTVDSSSRVKGSNCLHKGSVDRQKIFIHDRARELQSLTHSN